MRLPLPRLLGVFAITAVAVLGTTASANAATKTVCPAACDATNIQTAIGLATDFDTIEVASGTLQGAVIDKPLTLVGAKANIDGRLRPTLGPGKTVVDPILAGPSAGTGFDVQSDHVTIAGFTFQSGQPGVQLRPGFSDYTVVNNIFFNNKFGVYANSNGADESLIRHNKFDRNNFTGAGAGDGIYSDQGAGRYTIDENDFLGNANTAVIFTAGPTVHSGFVNNDITITNNLVDSSTDGPTPPGSLALLARTRDVLIENNGVHGTKDTHAIYLETTKNVDIVGNEIEGLSDGWSAIRLKNNDTFLFPYGTPNQNVSVIGNDIHDNQTALGLNVNDNSHIGELEVHYNRFVGNDVAVRNGDIDQGDDIDAENNWWGCNEGPNTADCDSTEKEVGPIAGTGDDAVVDADPWLVLGLASQKNPLALNGQTSKISAGLRQNSDGDELDTPPVPDQPVAFATTLGIIAPPSDVMHLGGAFSVLTSGPTAGD